MRTNSDSTGSSDVSVIASLDALSLSSPSTSSPSITSGNQPGARVISGSSEDYEIILVPTDCTRRVSSSSTSSGVLVNATDSSETDGKGSDDSGAKGKSIARRERRRKLESAKGKAQTTTGTTTDNQATPKKAPQTLDSAIEKPQAHESSAGSTSSAFDEPHRKTRRGGQRNRMRLDRAEVRKTLTTVDDLTTPSTSPSKMRSTRSVTADDSSEDGASRFMDEGLDDEDEVDGMSVLEMRPESVGGTPVNRRKLNAGSVTTTEDASSCIDSFLSGEPAFLGNQANKLRLWQSLCIELGLVSLPMELPDLPGVQPTQPSSNNLVLDVPQSLTQARLILKTHAHINLVDYFAARAAGEDLHSLLHPTPSAVIRYTMKQKKFAALPGVKSDWLDPLLKDFGFKRSRAATAA